MADEVKEENGTLKGIQNLTVQNRKILILAILVLALVGVLIDYKEGLVMAIGGFLTLLKGDE